MEIADSARKHGVADEDMIHALQHPIADRLEGERWLIIGSGRIDQELEIVVLDPLSDEPVIIHAMPLRPTFRLAVTIRGLHRRHP